MTVNFSLIAKLHMKLCLIKGAKSEACIRPLFANPVTYNTSISSQPSQQYMYYRSDKNLILLLLLGFK